ncbi:MAG: hypothetical protein R2726_20505 [Acidimicrobiales bacterium]
MVLRRHRRPGRRHHEPGRGRRRAAADGTHRAVLSFWWIAADYLRASLLFTDGTNPTGSWLGPTIGPTVPTNGIYPFDPFTSPGIPVPAGTTKAVISFLTVIGPNPGPQVGLDVIDLTIC